MAPALPLGIWKTQEAIMKKKAIWTFLAVLGCSLITACCVPESIHPLSPLEEAVADPRLDGVWEWIDEDGNTDGSTHIYIRSEDSGVMEALMVVLDDHVLETLPFEGHITPDGETRYVNLRPVVLAAPKGEDGEIDIDDVEPWVADRYLFAKYSLSDDGLLRLWYLQDSVALADAIESGALKGDETGGGLCGGSETLITDEPGWILKFFETHDDDEIFEGPAIFRRLRAPREAS
jgi:hypothetical protein